MLARCLITVFQLMDEPVRTMTSSNVSFILLSSLLVAPSGRPLLSEEDIKRSKALNYEDLKGRMCSGSWEYAFLHSPRVAEVARSLFVPQLRDLIKKQRQYKMGSQYHFRTREVEDYQAFHRKVAEDVNSIADDFAIGETTRRNRITMLRAEAVRNIVQGWQKLRKRVMHERSIWGAQDQFGSIQHLMLATREDGIRRRPFLKINRRFTSHSEASYYDATGSARNQDASSATSALAKVAQEVGIKAENKNEDAETEASETDDEIAVAETVTVQKDKTNESKPSADISERRVMFSTSAQWVTPTRVRYGRFEIIVHATLQSTTYFIMFILDSVQPVDDPFGQTVIPISPDKLDKLYRWPVKQLSQIQRRRFVLRSTALELFLIDHTSLFFNFPQGDRDVAAKKILSVRSESFVYLNTLEPAKILQRSHLTDKWRRWEISNFEYLMHLNTLAGRSYNDLTQYPVFPWVLSDYSSDHIDLSDESVYRDLSQTMGMIGGESRAEIFRDRYESFEDPVVPKFHYGSHYSSPGIVLQYLLRLEPFTTAAIALQGGKFDLPDRLFHAVAETWHSATHETSDVRELIPEFFFLPDFLRNRDDFDLGVRQDKQRLGDVQLPPWAANPVDFVNIQRRALESEVVSNMIHHWIDLIFGYKQRGPAAVDACNVFYYMTYEGAVDLDKISDPVLRKGTEAQIIHFGQTPSQLLSKPHPPRMKMAEVALRLLRTLPTVRTYKFEITKNKKLFAQALKVGQNITKSFFRGIGKKKEKADEPTSNSDIDPESTENQITEEEKEDTDVVSDVTTVKHVERSFNGVSCLRLVQDKIVVVRNDGDVTLYKWWTTVDEKRSTPFSLAVEKSIHGFKTAGSALGFNLLDRSIDCPVAVVSLNGKLLFTGGYWDGSIRTVLLSQDRICKVDRVHHAPVTCLALSEDGNWLISGSKDGSAALSRLPDTEHEQGPKHHSTLVGHDSELTAVAVSSHLNAIVTSSIDSTVNLYMLPTLVLLRTLQHPAALPVHALCLCPGAPASLVLYSETDSILRVLSLNAEVFPAWIRCEEGCYGLTVMTDNDSAEYLVYGTSDGDLVMRTLPDLNLVSMQRIAKADAVLTAHLSPDEKYVITGCESGELAVVSDPSVSLKHVDQSMRLSFFDM
eukprot:GILJ01008639.1.p1 GENE.GILJ01008639.1~~GILJ01008639.1.p1  ORF type:complete len:1141 (-),score=180.40 GILJ01008639.1:233-3655(-)